MQKEKNKTEELVAEAHDVHREPGYLYFCRFASGYLQVFKVKMMRGGTKKNKNEVKDDNTPLKT